MTVIQSKKCSRCQLDKALSDFNRKSSRKDGLQSRCRACQKVESDRHYASNKEQYAGRNNRKVQALKDLIIRLKDVPCADCGGRFPSVCMDFDHQGDKEFNMATVPRRRLSEERVLAEAAKCEIVCANCHRVRSFGQGLGGSNPPL